MLSISYNDLPFALVDNLVDFYMTSEALPEVGKVRSISDAARLLFKLPPNKLKVYVSEGSRVYKIELYPPQGPSIKIPFGWFVYIPKEKRLDLYDVSSPDTPIIQWKNKKLAYSSYSPLMMFAQVDKVFQGIRLSS